EDGSIAAACPPLAALLHIMAFGSYHGMTADDPRVRGLFDRASMLSSDWYLRRLRTKQSRDVALWNRHVSALSEHPDLEMRLEEARIQLARVKSAAYLEELQGTIGADPSLGNPWLALPLEDYEDHMTSDPVQQMNALAELFGEALSIRRPESVAVFGVAGGNGLERLDPAVTRRVCAIDINPDYLAAVRTRYPNVPGLALHCLDLAEEHVRLAPVQLVHAALIFEHAGQGRCLDNAIDLVAPGGALSIVLQMPSAVEAAVGGDSRPSIQTLKDDFRLIEVDAFIHQVEGRGFRLAQSSRRPVAS